MNQPMRFAQCQDLEDLVEDPLSEFSFLNDNNEEDEKNIKRSFRDAANDMRKHRKE